MATKRDSERDQKVLREARERFRRASDWESIARARFKDDLKADAADAYNMYQWPTDIQNARTTDKKPMLTINKIRQHNLDVLNDARQSRVAIKFRPTGGEATYDAAQMFDGIARHIEYISNAETAYQHALAMAVRGGIGYIRLATDYVGDETFDQEIFIRRVPDPLMVYLDPDISEFDGSDARWGFIFSDIPKDEFERTYPHLKDVAQDTTLDPNISWVKENTVRIAEYFRCVRKPGRLLAFPNPENPDDIITMPESKVDKEMLASVIDNPATKTRNIELTTVEHFMIVGDHIEEEKVWPGRYVPICRCVGEETVIDGQLDRKGHTRALIDPQRIFNYNAPLALDTRLPTPTGWTTMADVKAGDWLFDEHGKPAQVQGLSPTYLFRDCFRVEFDDGSAIVADGEHKWTVEEINRKRPPNHPDHWTMKTITTADLTPKKHFIYAARPLDIPEADLPIDPYVLGAWLGDGHSMSARITSGPEDMHEMRGLLSACGYQTSEPRVYGEKTAGDISVYGIHRHLVSLGLMGNKHIPPAYLRASEAQRLALLQGLMDTDGNISQATRQCSFTSTIPALADGYAELLRSLGVKAVSAHVAGRAAVFPNGKTYTRQDATRFSFSAGPDFKAFRLSRKADLQEKPRPVHERRTKRHRIVSVTPVPWVPVKCLSIDTPTHLFLAGESMVPTHNSAAVEFGALQTKTPWLAAMEATEGNEELWNSANLSNYSSLPWKSLNDQGQPIPKPERIMPPMGAPVFMEGMELAAEWMRMASGQYQSDMGAPSNERSGVAIQQRQRQGDNATYHYLDHQASMIRFCGKQILDLVPKVYDTPRMLLARDEAGKETEVKVDVNAPEALTTQKVGEDQEQAVFNPTKGSFDVQADVGAAYATRRQEAFAAYTQILSSNKELTSVVGDIMLRFADFPGAEEAAHRLRRLVPKQALEDGPSPDVMALQQQLQALQGILDETAAKLAAKDGDHAVKQEKNAIDAYRAQSDRMSAIKEALAMDPEGLLRLVMSVIEEGIQTSGALDPAIDVTPFLAPPGPATGEVPPPEAMGGPAPPEPPPEQESVPLGVDA